MLGLAALDQTIVSTALPTITRELVGAARMSWVFWAYLIAATVAVPLYGKLADMHGARPALLVAVSVFLAGSALCGVSRDMTELILARSLQGLLGAVYALSTMVGPLVGGLIVEHLKQRAFSAALLLSCGTGFMLFGAAVFMPLCGQTVRPVADRFGLAQHAADGRYHARPLRRCR